MRRILLTLSLACLMAGWECASAQTETGTISPVDSVEYVPLQRFDFGTPNPNAVEEQQNIQEDFLKTASFEAILRTLPTPATGAPDYSIMAVAANATSYSVGHIPYQESVTPYGGRVYTIPFMTSPLAGFAPQVSLQYNSQAGNGLAGYGWNIGGLSSITMTNKNLYYHGETAPANVSDTDAAYSLDGVPLVRNDDASLAAEYPLETARGHIIVKKHMSGNVISYFTALYPDGSKATFGMTSNTTAKSVYPVTLWEDRFGNQVIYNYDYSNSDYRILSILFKRKNNSTYAGKLTFSYSSRMDRYTRYRAGQVSNQDYILKSVNTESAGSILCTYSLSHSLKNGVNLLTDVRCKNAGGEQFRPLTFVYGDNSISVPNPSKDFSKTDYLFLSTYFSSSSDVKFIYNRGKYMSDSYSDGVMILPSFDIYNVVKKKLGGLFNYYYQYGSKYAADQVVLVAPRLSYTSKVDNSITVGEGFQCIDAVDIDGDGVDEIVKVNFAGTSESSSTTTLKITVYGHNASTGKITQEKSFNVSVNGIVKDGDLVSPMQRCYHFGDFNGDGKAQLLTISYNKDFCHKSRTSYAALINLDSGSKVSESSLFSLSTDDKLFCIDLDGDGRTELCYATASGLNIYNQNGSSLALTKTAGGVTSAVLSEAAFHFTDINGDGYVDIACEPSGTSFTWNIYQYNGNSFSNKSILLQSRTEHDKFMFFDVNKDGLADLVNRNGTSVSVYLNENGTFINGNRLTSNLSFSENAQFVPCNMTGYNAMSDFLTIEGYYVNLYKFSQDLSSERLLTKFTNSLGATTVNNYANMSSSNYVYNVDASRTYNNVNGYAKTRFPLQLLYNTQTYTSPSMYGTEKVTDVWYSYFDACVHVKGLGFCGFGKVRTTDFKSILNKEFVTIETKNPESMGVTTKVALGHRMTQDNPYLVTEYTYDGHSTTYGKLNPRLTKSVESNSLTGVETTTTYTYTSYDLPSSIFTRRRIGTGAAMTEKLTRTYKNSLSASKYVLGIVGTETVTKEGDGNASASWIERTVTTYDDYYRPLTSKRYKGNGVATPPRPAANTADEGSSLAAVIPPDTTIVRPPRPPRPDAPLLVSETRWEYDTYGNVISEKSASYGATEFIGNTYTYDSDGRYMLTKTDALGHTTTYRNYTKFGKPSSQSDHKGRVTTFKYNDWGELLSRITPDGTITSTTSSWGGSGCYMVETSVSGKPSRRVDYDAAGREVRSGIRRFDLNWTFIDKVYGWTGRIEKVSIPFISSQGTEEPSLWNIYEYDEYRRPVSYTEASGKQTTWAYADNTTTETKNGVWSTKTMDANGNVISITDAGGTISYTLCDDGQPMKVTSPLHVVTTFAYDAYGRRIKIVDPSAGTQTDSYVWNSDGSSVLTSTNPNGSIVTYTDKYGRTTKVERPGEYTTDYAYDADNLLVSETSSNGTSKVYTYDSYDRVSTMKETVPDGKWLKKTFIYTLGGDVSSIKYESQGGVITTESFNYTYGTNTRIGLQGTDIRRISGLNEFGQPTSVTTGGISRTYEYNAYGIPTRRTMGDVMDFSYVFDPLTGNLLSRTDNLRSETETFGYDGLNRLVSMGDRTVTYVSNGNITSITGVGSMSYVNISRPYQVTSMTLEEDVVPSRVQNVTYTCYSRPSIMTEGGRSAAFTYNGDGDRVKMNVSDGASSVLKRYYIGGQYEVDETPSGTAERLYLGGDAYSAPMVYVKEGSGSWTLYNIGRDYLGNITHIATSDGILVEENSYDPWGRLRSPETKEIYPLGQEPELKLGRGYTGHEHLTWFGLINMNVRLYDPLLGRFLSPDPYVQMPDFTQNFNRYSYALNNPLVYSDESGEFWEIVIGAVIGGVSNWISNGGEFSWKGFGYFCVGAGVGALSAVTGGMLAGVTKAAGVFAGAAAGTLPGALTGGASSFLLNGGNNLLQGNNFMTNWQNSLISGMIGGGISGAVSGAFSGYKYSKERGFNPWTNEKITYDSPIKNGASLQPDPDAYCYADALEYADMGHNNTPMESFVEANGYAKGGDVRVYNKLYPEVKMARAESLKDIELLGALRNIEVGKEVIATIKSENQLHWVNLVGLTQGEKLSPFGGIISNFTKYKVWDSNVGVRYFYNNVFSNITIMRF